MSLFYAKTTDNREDDRLSIAREGGCDACPMRKEWRKLKHSVMEPTGHLNRPLIYVIGEAPGADEDEQGRQFIGRSGQLLRSTIREQINTDEIAFDNILACRPPNNRTPTPFEMECCRARLQQNILTVDPFMIVTYGSTPLKFFTGRDQIMAWRGRVMPKAIGDVNSYWIAFNLHPAFILRQGGDREGVDRKFLHTFNLDHKQIGKWLDTLGPAKTITSGYRKNITTYDGSDESQLVALERHLHRFRESGKRYAIDIETVKLSPLQPDYKWLSCAIGTHDDVAAFVVDHPRGWENASARRRVKRMVYRFLMADTIKEAHHAKFEMVHMSHQFGKDVVLDTTWDDTAAQAVALDERPGKKGNIGMTGLDSLTMINFGFELKSQSDVDRKNLLTAPVSELLYYNGMDTKYEHLLSTVQRARMDRYDRKSTRQRNKIVKSLCFMEQCGVVVNKKTARDFGVEYDETKRKTLNKIINLKEVREYENKYGKKYSPNSNDQLATVLRDILHVEGHKKTTSGGYSTDKEVLAELSKQGVKLADYTVAYREATKNKSTYVDSILGLIYPDGRLHSDFSHLFVVTGRLSSSNPNMQNFPSRNNKRARNIIVAPEGHCIAAVDYGQIEARVIASVARDRVFVNAIFEDYDIHMDWAKRVATKKNLIRTISDDALKKLRKDVKNQLVFPWFYGAQVPSVSQAIGLSEYKTQQLFDDFWQMFSGAKKWQQGVLAQYKKYGFVLSPFGRKRHHPMSPNECLNTPIQGAASDIVGDAMYALSMLAHKLDRPQLQPVLNIHDDLTFYLPEETFKRDLRLIVKTMTTLAYKWLIVPLSVEVSKGYEWGALEDYKKYETRDFMDMKNVMAA